MLSRHRLQFAMAVLLLGCTSQARQASLPGGGRAAHADSSPALPEDGPPAQHLLSDAFLDSLCHVIPVHDDCLRAAERAVLPSRNIERRGPELRIAVDSGPLRILRDVVADNDSAVRFTYAGYLAPLGAHLVRVGFYEGHGWVLVSAVSGRQLALDGTPILSPDRTHFAIISSDLDAQIQPTRIEIWLRLPDSAVREWRLDLVRDDGRVDWGPTSATWRSNDSVEIGTELHADSTPIPLRGKPVALVHRNGAWVMLGSAR